MTTKIRHAGGVIVASTSPRSPRSPCSPCDPRSSCNSCSSYASYTIVNPNTEPSLPAGLFALPARLSLAFIQAYQRWLSPFFHGCCRFHPSCSNYAVVAIQRFGFRRGWWLAIRRILRCNPFGRGGFDAVPELPTAKDPSAAKKPLTAPPHPEPSETPATAEVPATTTVAAATTAAVAVDPQTQISHPHLRRPM